MIKSFLALAIGTLISANAFAGYTGYSLGGGVSGMFVQNDETRAIVYFKFDLAIPSAQSPYPNRLGFSSNRQGEGSDRITAESTHFIDPGPSNFRFYSDFGGDQFTSFNIDLAYTAQANVYTYTGNYSTSVYAIGGFKRFSDALNGGAMVTAVDPLLLQELASEGAGNGGFVPYVGPSVGVPEPASLALFGVGILGVLGVARRRKA